MSAAAPTTTGPTATDAQPPSARHAGGLGPKLGFLAMVVGMFMAILDIQIVAASLSEIQAGLAASADEIIWVQNSYLIAEVIMIPLSGYLARAFGTRWTFVLSAGGFTLTSLLCAFATSMDQMIVFRALQGFVGGAMIPLVFASAYTIFPRDKQAGVTVVVGLVATIAPTIGPTLGGWLTESLSWHWLFLVNVVPGAIVTVVVWALIDIDRPQPHLIRSMDVPGLVMMALFLGSLDFVLEDGARNDWFDDHHILTFSIVAAAAGIGFFWRTLTARNPIVDLTAFKDRNFATGCLFSFVLGISLYGLVYLQPQFLARVRELNALQIGEVMFVTGLAQFLSAPIAGGLSRKVDPRLMLSIGFGLIAVSNIMLTNLTADSDYWELFLPQILRGMGFMFGIIPVNVLALGTLPPEKLKNASGLYNLMRNLGGAFGLAGITTAMTERSAFHWARLSEHVNPARPEVQARIDTLAARLAEQVPGIDGEVAAVKMIASQVMQQVTVLTFIDVFWLMALVVGGAIAVVFVARKPDHATGGGH